MRRLGLWYLTSLSTIFQFYFGGRLIGGGNLEYPEKTTDLSEVADKLYHIKLYRVHLAWAGFELTMLVVIGTDCIGSYNSNYDTNRTKTAPIVEWTWPVHCYIVRGIHCASFVLNFRTIPTVWYLVLVFWYTQNNVQLLFVYRYI
jgi:hypothetical protein